jgi:hypothetical protein
MLFHFLVDSIYTMNYMVESCSNLKVSRSLHNNLAFTKFLNPYKLCHGLQEFMNILIPSYFLVQIIPEMRFEGLLEAFKNKPSSMNKQQLEH